MRAALLLFVVAIVCSLAPIAYAATDTVYLEDLTWTEVRAAQKAGKTTIIIPVGGTEQNGPHMALGKHNFRVHALAGGIAAALGDALVAPVVAYVPEGAISPPTGHMRFPGTISIPDAAFQSTLEAAAKSFKQNGFTDIVLIGDSGNYQGHLKAVALRLNRAWAASPARAHFIDEYYRAAQSAYPQALRAKGLTEAQIGTHAGAADTSLLMAIDPTRVRSDRLDAAHTEGAAGGAAGDPRASSAALGQLGVDLIVSSSVDAIRKARKASR
ncbi:MAG: creatininase family protein [Burkholderiaceae bacterium]